MDSVPTESTPWLPDNADYVTRRRARGHCRAGGVPAGWGRSPALVAIFARAMARRSARMSMTPAADPARPVTHDAASGIRMGRRASVARRTSAARVGRAGAARSPTRKHCCARRPRSSARLGRRAEPLAGADVPGRRFRLVPHRTRMRARAEAGPAAILPARGGRGRLQGRARTPPGWPGPRSTSRALSRLRAREPEGARGRWPAEGRAGVLDPPVAAAGLPEAPDGARGHQDTATARPGPAG